MALADIAKTREIFSKRKLSQLSAEEPLLVNNLHDRSRRGGRGAFSADARIFRIHW